MPNSAIDVINPAVRHTRQQLLQPFRFGQWARLAFVGFLAGEITSGGGCGFNWPAPHHTRPAERTVTTAFHSPLHPGWSIGTIIFLVLVGIALFLLFLYVNSVMRFVLFDSVVTRECSIRRGWKTHRRHGLRLFGWHFLILAVSSTGLLIMIAFPLAAAWVLGWFSHPRDHLIALVSSGFLFFCVFVGFVLVALLVQVLTKDFVVPQMALENLSAMEGWRRLWTWLQVEKANYAGYIGMKAVLAIAAGVFLAIIMMIVFLAFMIPVVVIGVFAGLSGAIAGLSWTFSTIILAVAAALIAFAICMFVISFSSVPAVVFFPAYSIYFLAPRYPPLGAVLWTDTSTHGPQPSPPAEPPPWSPAPV